MIARGWVYGFFSQMPDGADGLAHLLEVALATRTHAEVRLEPSAFGGTDASDQVAAALENVTYAPALNDVAATLLATAGDNPDRLRQLGRHP